MASCSTSQWVSSAPYVRATVTLNTSSSDGDTAVLDWILEYVASSAADTSVAKSYEFKIAGSVVKSGTYSIDGKTGTKTIASGTKSIAKSTAAQTISFAISFGFNLTWSGTYKGTLSASSTISVPAKSSYTISYNANGGSGAPSAQTKWFGTALTLSSTKPTRSGYAFQGWATSSTGSVTYAAGASYTANSSVTLYAVWKANTYKVTFNANGGTGAPSAQTKTYGVNLTLSSTKPTRTNYTFKGWGTSASATTVSYAAGATYKNNAAITLYAVWELSYTKPRITSLKAPRCTSDGTLFDTGTYAKVSFSWVCDKTVSSIKIEWRLSSSSTWTNSVTVSASGTSGNVSQIVGNNALSVDHTYDIQVTVTDSVDKASKNVMVNGVQFPFDALPENKGVSFGKPAELSGHADFQYTALFRKNAVVTNGVAFYGTTTDGERLSLAYVNSSNNSIFGYGGYAAKIGDTGVYGNSVRIGSNNGVFVDGMQIATNKVLWSGGYYMSDAQSCTLTSAVSKQANGIVLVWSEYADGATVNANFNMCFVPKHFVSAHSDKGVGLALTSATMNVVAPKYVYIADTTIRGYANNNAATTTVECGIKITPKNFVLRYVIGV